MATGERHADVIMPAALAMADREQGTEGAMKFSSIVEKKSAALDSNRFTDVRVRVAIHLPTHSATSEAARCR